MAALWCLVLWASRPRRTGPSTCRSCPGPEPAGCRPTQCPALWLLLVVGASDGLGSPCQPRWVPGASRSCWRGDGRIQEEDAVGGGAPNPAVVPAPAALQCPHRPLPGEFGNGAGNGLVVLVQGELGMWALGTRSLSQLLAPDLAPAGTSVPCQDLAPRLSRWAQTLTKVFLGTYIGAVTCLLSQAVTQPGHHIIPALPQAFTDNVYKSLATLA